MNNWLASAIFIAFVLFVDVFDPIGVFTHVTGWPAWILLFPHVWLILGCGLAAIVAVSIACVIAPLYTAGALVVFIVNDVVPPINRAVARMGGWSVVIVCAWIAWTIYLGVFA